MRAFVVPWFTAWAHGARLTALAVSGKTIVVVKAATVAHGNRSPIQHINPEMPPLRLVGRGFKCPRNGKRTMVRYLCDNCGKEIGKCQSPTCDCGGVEGMCYNLGIEHKVTDYLR
jgi:hypothetical protein